jgi:hypothetical protein
MLEKENKNITIEEHKPCQCSKCKEERKRKARQTL